MTNQVNITNTMPLMVAYRMVRVVDDRTKKHILALYKVHLDSEGKVWGLVGQPLFLAEDKGQLDETVGRYIEDLKEGLIQADEMRKVVLGGGIYTRESFPEPGATNPLADTLRDPLTKNPDAVPNNNENLDNVR